MRTLILFVGFLVALSVSPLCPAVGPQTIDGSMVLIHHYKPCGEGEPALSSRNPFAACVPMQ